MSDQRTRIRTRTGRRPHRRGQKPRLVKQQGIDSAPPMTTALASSPTRRSATPLAARVFVLDLCSAGLAAAVVAMSLGTLPAVGIAVTLSLWFVGLKRLGGYDERLLVASPLRGWTLFSAVGKVAVLIALVPLIVPAFPAASYVALLALALLLTTMSRNLLARWLRRRQADGRYKVPVVVRGPAGDIKTLLDVLARDGGQPFSVVATQATSGTLISDLAVSSDADTAAVAAEVGAATVVLVGPQQDPPDALRRTIWMLESAGMQVAWVPIASSLSLPRVLEIGLTGVPALVFEDRYLAPERSIRKMVVDAAVSLLATVLLAPLLLMIGWAIKVDSAGSVLYRQTRVGRGGRTFTMYKFRTMHDGAEAELDALAEANIHDGGTLFKIPDDPRTTRVGRWLRKYSLDELPQLFNILRGEMSLVGPRPPLPAEVANYPADLHRRFLVRPGLTGLWQVSGRSDLDPVSSARLDAYYVEHWSPMMDTRILLKTVKVVLTSDGAY